MSKNGHIRSNPKLSEEKRRNIRHFLHVRDLHGELHFHVACINENKGVYAKLKLLKSTKKYEVMKFNEIFIIYRTQCL